VAGSYEISTANRRVSNFLGPIPYDMRTCSCFGVFLVLSFAVLAAPVQTDQVTHAYRVKERGPHHRVWEKTAYEPTPDGPLPRVQRYTELKTAMHFRNDDGQWEEAQEKIEILPNSAGAVANKGQHKVIWPADASGIIEMSLPGEKGWLRSQVIGLAYHDSDSGQHALIAEVKSSTGEIHGDNVIVYPECFAGDGFTASLRYTYKLAEFEQDVVLHQQPPPPADYGMNPATTKLQVLTEFLDPPQPVRTADFFTSHSGKLIRDESLGFGAMTMGRGKAFSTDRDSKEIPVTKQWLTIDGRDVLVEEVHVMDLHEDLEALPEADNAMNSTVRPRRRTASLQQILPVRRLARNPLGEIKMASVSKPMRGLVLDYVTVNTSQTDYIFDSYNTFYISGNVSLWGTNTTFEGGTVIKYASNASLLVNTPITWLGRNYGPVLMISKDDNRAGENLPGASGNPGNGQYARTALHLNAGVSASDYELWNLRIANAQTAVAINGGSTHTFGNVQVLNSGVGFAVTNTTIKVQNALLVRVLTNFTGNGAVGHVEHLTSHTASWLNHNLGTNFFVTNSLLIAVTNTAPFAHEAVSVHSSSDGIFHTVGAADHYLPSGSTNRNSGVTAITPRLSAELRRKTTFPPTVFSNEIFSVESTFGPIVERELDIPDRGFHYDALDYVFGGVTANTNITFAPGTAVGWFELPGSSGPGYGISIPNGVTASLVGTADSPCILARYSTVQEGVNNTWNEKGWLAGIRGTGSMQTHNPSRIVATFLRSYLLAAGPCHFRDYNNMLRVTANHCEFYVGNQGGYNTQSAYTNTLFDRIYLVNNTGLSAASFVLRNCTHYGGWVDFGHSEPSAPYWYSSIKDCTFDRTLFSIGNPSGGNPLYITNSHNAYVFGAATAVPTGGRNVTNSTHNWQVGPFGRFYLPAHSPLIDAGSVGAGNVGLHDFTTQVPFDSPEGSTPVDIGYHNPSPNRCLQAGDVIDPGTLNYMTTNICTGGSPTLPVMSSAAVFSPALVRDWINYAYNLQHFETNTVSYVSGNLVFTPALPATFTQAGDHHFNVTVTATASGTGCSNLIANLGLFVVRVWGTNHSDYDGICDCQEALDITDPQNSDSVKPVALGHWGFNNTNTWVGAQGQLPLQTNDLRGVFSWNSNAVRILNTGSSLVYRDQDTDNCNANLVLRKGSIRFWFKPLWTSLNAGGTGPQTESRLLEVGSKGTTNGWFAIGLHPTGTNLWFATQTNTAGTLITNVSTSVQWTSNLWQQVVLTYSSNGTALYINGNLAAVGSGVTAHPGLAARALGFSLGSSRSAGLQAKGVFDNLQTFNYCLDPETIGADFHFDISLDSDGDGWPDLIEDFLGSSPHLAGSMPASITIDSPANGSTVSR